MSLSMRAASVSGDVSMASGSGRATPQPRTKQTSWLRCSSSWSVRLARRQVACWTARRERVLARVMQHAVMLHIRPMCGLDACERRQRLRMHAMHKRNVIPSLTRQTRAVVSACVVPCVSAAATQQQTSATTACFAGGRSPRAATVTHSLFGSAKRKAAASAGRQERKAFRQPWEG